MSSNLRGQVWSLQPHRQLTCCSQRLACIWRKEPGHDSWILSTRLKQVCQSWDSYQEWQKVDWYEHTLAMRRESLECRWDCFKTLTGGVKTFSILTYTLSIQSSLRWDRDQCERSRTDTVVGWEERYQCRMEKEIRRAQCHQYIAVEIPWVEKHGKQCGKLKLKSVQVLAQSFSGTPHIDGRTKDKDKPTMARDDSDLHMR